VETITEQLHKIIDKLEDEINEHRFCTLIFKIKEGEFVRFEKEFSVNRDEMK
jgi:hypothetical protein